MCVESCLVQRTEVYAVRILLSVSFGSAAKMFRISQEKKKKKYCGEIPIFKTIMNDRAGLTKPGEVGDFFILVSMKSPNFCQKAKF